MNRVAAQAGRVRGHDSVPASSPRNAVDARLAALLAVPPRRLGRRPDGSGPSRAVAEGQSRPRRRASGAAAAVRPKSLTGAASGGGDVAVVLGVPPRLDTPALAVRRFTWRSSFSTSWSIDAFMSGDASRARSVGPFVQIVASATWLSAIEGFFCSESSTSTCVCSASCFVELAPAFARRTRGSTG